MSDFAPLGTRKCKSFPSASGDILEMPPLELACHGPSPCREIKIVVTRHPINKIYARRRPNVSKVALDHSYFSSTERTLPAPELLTILEQFEETGINVQSNTSTSVTTNAEFSLMQSKVLDNITSDCIPHSGESNLSSFFHSNTSNVVPYLMSEDSSSSFSIDQKNYQSSVSLNVPDTIQQNGNSNLTNFDRNVYGCEENNFFPPQNSDSQHHSFEKEVGDSQREWYNDSECTDTFKDEAVNSTTLSLSQNVVECGAGVGEI